jgi:hypothetical protein
MCALLVAQASPACPRVGVPQPGSHVQEVKSHRNIEGRRGAASKPPKPPKAAQQHQDVLPGAAPVATVAAGKQGGTLVEDSKLPYPTDPPPGGVTLASDLPPEQLSMLLQV